MYSTARSYLPVQYLAPAYAIEGNIEMDATPLAHPTACMTVQPGTGHLVLSQTPGKGREKVSPASMTKMS